MPLADTFTSGQVPLKGGVTDVELNARELTRLLDELLVEFFPPLPPHEASNKVEPIKVNKRVACFSKRGILTVFIQPIS